MDLYFRLMGCVTWIIAIVGIIVQVAGIRESLKYLTRKETCIHILNLIAIVVIGSGLGMLFMEYGKSIA